MDISSLAQEIYNSLGSGYNECVYSNAFQVLLRKYHIPYEVEKIVPIIFENHTIGYSRLDFVIRDTVVELKSVKTIQEGMRIQIKNYLKLTGLKNGILINFPIGGERIEYEIFH
uniref:GxxExxY protein n=1 Tax=viral metagenome TaxID=1070528 RepID=A0A6C0JUF8_9ZZZZ